MAGRNLSLTDRVTCPFNPSHIMNYSKFHNHFVACQKAHPHDRRKQCPYNASELIYPEDMDEHVINCQWRIPSNSFPSVNMTEVWSFDDSPYHIEFGESSEPMRHKKEVTVLDSGEEIDSISVIEVQRNNQSFEPYILQNINQYSNSLVDRSSKMQNRGFGRGAFFKKLSTDRSPHP